MTDNKQDTIFNNLNRAASLILCYCATIRTGEQRSEIEQAAKAGKFLINDLDKKLTAASAEAREWVRDLEKEAGEAGCPERFPELIRTISSVGLPTIFNETIEDLELNARKLSTFCIRLDEKLRADVERASKLLSFNS